MRQKCTLAAKKGNNILACIEKIINSNLKEVVFPLYWWHHTWSAVYRIMGDMNMLKKVH